MDTKGIMLRVGTILASGMFALLMYVQSEMADRGMARLVGAAAGAFVGLAIYGFICIGRHGAERKR